MIWPHATGALDLSKPRILGIVNVTPDSFSDGGRFDSVDDALREIETMIRDGADVIDIGGESTRPQGATPVDAREELRRVMPVIERAVREFPDTPLSIDTVKAPVARAALEAGASIVNDVSGSRLDAELPSLCALAGAGVVLMHSRGDVSTMATFTHAVYGGDPVGEMVRELARQRDIAVAAGVARERIVLDPGIGFSKRSEHSVAALAQLSRFVELGHPVLVGVSRKRVIGELSGVVAPADRVAGTVAANVAAFERGATLFRVHDVKPNREALDVAWGIGISVCS